MFRHLLVVCGSVIGMDVELVVCYGVWWFCLQLCDFTFCVRSTSNWGLVLIIGVCSGCGLFFFLTFFVSV